MGCCWHSETAATTGIQLDSVDIAACALLRRQSQRQKVRSGLPKSCRRSCIFKAFKTRRYTESASVLSQYDMAYAATCLGCIEHTRGCKRDEARPCCLGSLLSRLVRLQCHLFRAQPVSAAQVRASRQYPALAQSQHCSWLFTYAQRSLFCI